MKSRHLEARARAREATALRMSGMTWTDIAEKLNYNSAEAAYKSVNDLLKRNELEVAGDYRTTMLARLDAILAAMWPKVKRGDVKAATVVVRVEERRARLLGADAPQRIGFDGDAVTIRIVREDVKAKAAPIEDD